MDFTEILRGLKVIDDLSKPTHASALLLWFSKPSASSRKVLELGSGSGIVSIGMAKIYGREVVGLEIVEDLVERARRSAEINGVGDLVEFVHGDVKDIRNIFKAESFDMVISNPPHHIGKERSPDPYRSIARSGDKSLVDKFVEAIFWTLKNGGEYSLVLSPENLIDWIYALRLHRLEPKRVVFFHPKDKAELVSIRGRKNAKVGLIVEKPLGC